MMLYNVLQWKQAFSSGEMSYSSELLSTPVLMQILFLKLKKKYIFFSCVLYHEKPQTPLFLVLATEWPISWNMCISEYFFFSLFIPISNCRCFIPSQCPNAHTDILLHYYVLEQHRKLRHLRTSSPTNQDMSKPCILSHLAEKPLL